MTTTKSLAMQITQFGLIERMSEESIQKLEKGEIEILPEEGEEFCTQEFVRMVKQYKEAQRYFKKITIKHGYIYE